MAILKQDSEVFDWSVSGIQPIISHEKEFFFDKYDYATLLDDSYDLGENECHLYTKSPTLVCSRPDQRHCQPRQAVDESQGYKENSFHDEKVFTIRSIPGKGQGMVATTAISRGLLIHSERPLMQYYRYAKDAVPLSQFKALKEEDKRLVLSLANVRKDMGTVMGILWTNAIPINDTSCETALFATASRINHACLPNANQTWHPERGVMTTYATRDIEAGEEITSTYIKGFASYEGRQEHLKELLAFNCSCWVCTLPPHERSLSDRRIEEINLVRKTAEKLWYWIQPEDALPAVGKLVRLYESESVVDWHPAEAYELAWKIAAPCDKNRAAIFAQRAAEIRSTVEGRDSIKAREWRAKSEEAERMVDLCEGGIGRRARSHMAGRDEDFERWLFHMHDCKSSGFY